ncbi:unnamed protein product [Rhizophagus irregularis]|uniref:Uncharacterized protein n=1 Tax=Rhizophagus irregularis TaxID=588596 RepID=A0A916E4I8_9GLOM|nr:unnamed protein product [Rhizophagus irregularis]
MYNRNRFDIISAKDTKNNVMQYVRDIIVKIEQAKCNKTNKEDEVLFAVNVYYPLLKEAIDSQGQEEVKDATSGEEAKKVTKVSKENKVGPFRLSNAIIQNLTQNLTKLFAAGPHVPDLPDQIAEFLYEFVGKTNLNEIRETKKSKVFGNNYDHENHHDKDYIIYALHSLVREIQGGSM